MKRIVAAVMAAGLLSGCTSLATMSRGNMDSFLAKAPRDMDSVALQKQESWHYWLWAKPGATVGQAADDAKECSEVPEATAGQTAGQVAGQVAAMAVLGVPGAIMNDNPEAARIRFATDACMRGKGYTNGLEGKV